MSCYVQEVELDNVQLVLPVIQRIFPRAQIKIELGDVFFVALYGGKIIGFLHINEKENFILLKGIGIDEKYRNAGNGSMLLEKLDEIARTTEKKVFLKVKCTNPVVLLYERYGFVLKKFGPVYTLVKKMNN